MNKPDMHQVQIFIKFIQTDVAVCVLTIELYLFIINSLDLTFLISYIENVASKKSRDTF